MLWLWWINFPRTSFSRHAAMPQRHHGWVLEEFHSTDRIICTNMYLRSSTYFHIYFHKFHPWDLRIWPDFNPGFILRGQRVGIIMNMSVPTSNSFWITILGPKVKSPWRIVWIRVILRRFVVATLSKRLSEINFDHQALTNHDVQSKEIPNTEVSCCILHCTRSIQTIGHAKHGPLLPRQEA